MSERAKSAGIIQPLLTAEAKEKAAAARKLSRLRTYGYPTIGRHNERVKLVHRVRAEKALGKPLPVGAQVHHPDEDKLNLNSRLVICQDAAYHQLLHFRMRIKAAGGNPNTDRICSRCKAVKPIAEFNRSRWRKADGLDSFCRTCISEKNAIQKARRLGMAS